MSKQERTFNVIVRPAEEGGYWAEVLELPGCVSQGETKDELLQNIIEAIQACLAAQGESATSPKDTPTESPDVWRVPVPV